MKQNMILWINGQHGLNKMIDSAEWDIGLKIQNKKDELASFNTKQVKGKTYWYQWTDGKWKYLGRKDPRPKLLSRIKQLEQMKSGVKKRFKDRIHAELGNHLIIDPKQLKTPQNESVKVSDVIRRIARPSGPGRITK